MSSRKRVAEKAVRTLRRLRTMFQELVGPESLRPGTIHALRRLSRIVGAEPAYELGARRWKELRDLTAHGPEYHKNQLRKLLEASDIEGAQDYFDTHSQTLTHPTFLSMQSDIHEARYEFGKALGVIDDLIGRGRHGTDLLMRRGELLQRCGRPGEAETLYRALLDKHPGNVRLLKRLAKTATEARNYALATQRWRELIELQPENTGFHRFYIRSLLDIPDIEAAQAHIDKMVPILRDPVFESVQVSVYQAQKDFEGALAFLDDLLERMGQQPRSRHDWLLQRKAWLHLRIHRSSKEAFHLNAAQATLRELTDNPPVRFGVRVMAVKALIAAGRFDEASAAIDQLPNPWSRQTMELRMWRRHQQGDVAGAKQIWSDLQQRHSVPHIRPCRPTALQRRDDNPIPRHDDEIILFTAIRNEMWRLPWFLDYYRALGVDRFVFVDNDSSDGGGEFLLGEPDVNVYWTADSYAAAQSAMQWVNELARRHGSRGWVLYADVDEALVFPGSETTGLRTLTDYMASRDQEALCAFMLDMFSDDDAPPPKDGFERNFIARYPLFDDCYHSMPSVRCPYYVKSGGVRRLFNASENLTKTPLIRGGRGISFLQSSHIISPAVLSDVTGAMLHFKMVGDLRETFERDLSSTDRIGPCRRRYASYLKHLNELGDRPRLSNERTVRYVSSKQLEERSLIESSSEFARLTTLRPQDG